MSILSNTTFSRRRFMKTASASSLALLAAMQMPSLAFGKSMPSISIALDWIPDVEFANLFVAKANGFFAKQNVDVTYFPGGPNAPDPLVSLAAGRAQIGQCIWTPFLNAVSKDNDLVILGAAFPVNPGCIISLPSKPIKTAADLKGKTLLIQYPSLETELKGIALYNDLSADFMTRPTGFTADALFAGDGDGYLAFITNQPLELEAQGMVRGKDFIVTPMSELGYPIPASMFAVQRSFLQQHREELVSFFVGLIQGQDACVADPVAAVKQVVEHDGRDLGLESDNQLQVLKETLRLAQSPEARMPFLLPAKQQAEMLKFASKIGDFGALKASSIFDMSVLEEASKRVV
jgi:ABC-type nitrate/sulfonate/bicarbonate transport system substrate-binding protein